MMSGMKGITAGRLALAGLLALAVGCAKQPIVKEKVPTGSKEEVISRLNNQAEATRSVTANLSVKLQTSKMDRPEGCDGKLAAMYPDKLRIRGSHPLLDYPPFDIGSDGRTWFWHGHFQSFNEMHYGPTAYLEQRFEPMALLKPRDVVLALGVGAILEGSGNEVLFTRNPGHYLLTEVVNNADGRHILKRIFVDPDLMAIYKMETYRPDGGIDMIAEMTFDEKASRARNVPVSARIRLLRTEAFLLDLTLKDRNTGEEISPRRFAMPSTEGIPNVKQYGAGAESQPTEPGPKPIFR